MEVYLETKWLRRVQYREYGSGLKEKKPQGVTKQVSVHLVVNERVSRQRILSGLRRCRPSYTIKETNKGSETVTNN